MIQLLVLFHFAASVILPDYVGRLINNQGRHGISDELMPLDQEPCASVREAVCYTVPERAHSPRLRRLELHLALPTALHHQRLRIALLHRQGNTQLLTVRAGRNLVVDLGPALPLAATSLALSCVTEDCSRLISRPDRLAFLVGQSGGSGGRQRRSQVSSVSGGPCRPNQMGCCVEAVRGIPIGAVFDNASIIAAPSTVPVTYCRGNCYPHNYRGNYMYAMMKYYYSLESGAARQRLMQHFPCCSARQFRSMRILYYVGEGRYRIQTSDRLLVDRCDCI